MIATKSQRKMMNKDNIIYYQLCGSSKLSQRLLSFYFTIPSNLGVFVASL